MGTQPHPMLTHDLPGIPKVNQGKVREIYDLGTQLLLVATDRMSAFDVVLPEGIPFKGQVLTQLSAFWFGRMEGKIHHHLISADVADYPESLRSHAEELRGRSMLVSKCQPLAIECVVRGYLAGSGWKEYQASGEICGVALPEGLRESDELPEPIFTPATKATTGHDENISFDRAVEIVGGDVAEQARELSICIYNDARKYAGETGIIICDTKFEFGLLDSELILIDEVLTPDSSRFWPAAQYDPGRSQPSFDKQFIRDFLETLELGQSASRTTPSRRRHRGHFPTLPRGLSPSDRGVLRRGLLDLSFRAYAEDEKMMARQSQIKQILEEVIDEMVSKGIYWTEACSQFEKLFITRALKQSNGSLSQAAEIMGIHRNTLSKKVQEHKINRKRT